MKKNYFQTHSSLSYYTYNWDVLKFLKTEALKHKAVKNYYSFFTVAIRKIDFLGLYDVSKHQFA